MTWCAGGILAIVSRTFTMWLMGNHLCDPETPVNALFHLSSLISLNEARQSYWIKEGASDY